jgi:thiamine-phosphate pyrophosphorylase
MNAIAWRGFYAILDVREDQILDEAGLLARAEALLRAGPCCLQLRAKRLSTRAMRDLAVHLLLPACHAHRVPFCINDRVDVALAVGADVVHIGQEDLPLAATRAILHGTDIHALAVGVSTHNLEQALAAAGAGADYIGVGPIFGTRTKDNPDPIVGLALLAQIVRQVAVPVVAIGGITPDNVGEVAEAGASAAAVIAAVTQAPHPDEAGRAIAAAFRA